VLAGRLVRPGSSQTSHRYFLHCVFPAESWVRMPLAGAQFVALNMSNVDLPVMLHFALFDGSGYVLKPEEMRSARPLPLISAAPLRCTSSDCGFRTTNGYDSFFKERCTDVESSTNPGEEDYWPLLRNTLHRTTLHILSLHNLPQVASDTQHDAIKVLLSPGSSSNRLPVCSRIQHGERRPCFDGTHGACHKYVPEFSGSAVPPHRLRPSSNNHALTIALHPIGGIRFALPFCRWPPTVVTSFPQQMTATACACQIQLILILLLRGRILRHWQATASACQC
jgi:hypothetical protein